VEAPDFERMELWRVRSNIAGVALPGNMHGQFQGTPVHKRETAGSDAQGRALPQLRP